MCSVGAKAAYGYDPRTSKELWRVDHPAYSSAARPVYHEGRFIVVTGFSQGAEMTATKAGGSSVITDTHIPQRLKALPPRVFEVFRGVDRILHAGDINSRRVLDRLAEIAPVEAVAGNADLFKHGLPSTRVIEVEGWRIGLVHGHGGWPRYLRSKARLLFGYDEEHHLKIVHGSFGPVDAARVGRARGRV